MAIGRSVGSEASAFAGRLSAAGAATSFGRIVASGRAPSGACR